MGKDIYPRAQPHRPPSTPDLAIPSAPTHPAGPPTLQSSQLVLFAGISALFLAIGLAVGVLVINKNANRKDPQPETKQEPKPDVLTQRGQEDVLPVSHPGQDNEPAKTEKPTPKKDGAGSGIGGLKELPVEVTPKKDDPPPTRIQPGSGGKITSQPGKPTDIPEAVTEALGGLTVALLYQTYLNIGVLADVVEGDVYTKEDGGKMLDTVAGLMTTIETQLTKVARQAITEDEKKSLAQAQRIMDRLRTQSRELRSYWDTNNKDNVTKFHQARKDAWDGIKSLLNLQD